MNYYSDFRFGHKRLSDFEGRIYNKDGIKQVVGTVPTHRTLEIPNKGVVYYGTDYTQPKQFDVDVYFGDDVSTDEISSWICAGGEKEFQYEEDDKYIMACYNGVLNFDVYFEENDMSKSLVTIPFIAHDPHWRIKNEKKRIISNIQLNTIHYFRARNNVESYPLIKIKPKANRKVRFKWNGEIVVLSNLLTTREYYIDSENGEFYYLQAGTKISSMGDYYSNEYYDMPLVKPFVNNTFELIEGSCDIEIDFRSRIIG